MACCGGSCSCGKGHEVPTGNYVHLVQLSSGPGTISASKLMGNPGQLQVDEKVVEIRFKNNRKAFYRSHPGISQKKDDRLVVEAGSGYDIGTVSLTGEAAEKQFTRKRNKQEKSDLGRVYRRATQDDLEKWLDSKRRERDVFLFARRIFREYGLEINVSDVEFRGDGKKVTVFYTSSEGVDTGKLMEWADSTFGVEVSWVNQIARTPLSTA